MTRAVERGEVVDYVTYEDRRGALRDAVMEAKALRRVHVGPLTFLFENHDTVHYQVQEMMRAERMVKEADIVHEIETYNELLGGPGELGCSLLVELDDAEERQEKLTKWLDLPKHLYVKRPDGTKAYARYDERQVGDTRVSSVQYLKFAVGRQAPVAVGCDHPDSELDHETALTAEQRAALQADLGE
jgi:uncharacterized protein DUF3501